MPYVILRQDQNPGVWYVQADNDLDFLAFLNGTQVQAPVQPVHFELGEDSAIYSDFFDFPYFVCSDALKRALTDFGIDNIDWY